MTKVAVRYVGHKPIKRDTVTESLAVWVGHGAVAEVPEEVAARLCPFPDVWQLADAPVIERPAPVVASEAEEEAGEVVEPEEAEPELHPNDEFGFEKAPEAAGPVTIAEIVERLPMLDKEKDFSETGKPKIESVRALFPERDVVLANVRAAWVEFTGG
jgi:hypothetical protein